MMISSEKSPARHAMLVLLISLLFIAICHGQSAKSVYSKYEKEKYEDAAEGFRKVLCESPSDVIANLGMGMLCVNKNILPIPAIRDNYDFFQAFRYIRRSKLEVNAISEAELKELNSMIKSLPDVKDKVYKEHDTIETKLYQHLITRKSLDSAEIFINEFPDSRYYNDILQLRNNVYFDKVKKSGDVVALNNFIERCPDADSLNVAIQLRDLAAFDTLMLNKTRTLDAVYNYLNRYPLSKKYHIVIGLRDNLESEKAQKEGTSEAYSHFIENFPRSSKASVVRDKYIELLYQAAKKKNTLDDYTEFLNRFPLSKPFAQSARESRDSLCLIIYSATVDSLNLFITNFPASRLLREAINLRDMKAYENARQAGKIDAYEEFIHRYPSALEVNEALSARDSLVLEQVRFMSSELEFTKFLSDYPYLIHQPKTTEILDEVLYREAKRLDDAEYYKDFLDRCPRSVHVKEIQELLKSK